MQIGTHKRRPLRGGTRRRGTAGGGKKGASAQSGGRRWPLRRFPGQPSSPLPPVSAPEYGRSAPAWRPSAAQRRRGNRERRSVHSHLLEPGACLRCRCTALVPAEAPSPRGRRRRLGTRPADPTASPPSARAAPSSRVPRLFSSALSCCLSSGLHWVARGLGAGRGQQGPKAENSEGSQVNSNHSWPHLCSIILLRCIQGLERKKKVWISAER